MALAGLPIAAGACDERERSAPVSRQEVVTASVPASAPSAAPVASAKPAPRPHALCTDAPLDRAMPKDKLDHAKAVGAPALGSSIPTGTGKWTWINLWAAWCVPCKQELPRLFSWQHKLAQNVDFAFVSLDDDERQLSRFLEDQPPSGLRTSWWLPEGKTRDRWLSGVGVDKSPELPVQILVDPRGRVRCIVRGAVEDGDFERVGAVVAGR